MAKKGSNTELTSDHTRALSHHYTKLWLEQDAKKTRAAAAAAKVKKQAKKAGVAFDTIKDLIRLKTPQGEAAFRQELDRQVRSLNLAGIPIGTQFSFLDEPDRTPVIDRAYGEGQIAGFEGASPQHQYQGEAEQFWLKGYHDGQQTLMAALDLTKAGVQQIAAEAQAAQDEPKKPKGKTAAPKKTRQRRAKGNGEAAAAFEG